LELFSGIELSAPNLVSTAFQSENFCGETSGVSSRPDLTLESREPESRAWETSDSSEGEVGAPTEVACPPSTCECDTVVAWDARDAPPTPPSKVERDDLFDGEEL